MNGKYRPEDLYPMLRGENREVVIHPDDRKYGALLVGGQGTGKCIGPEDLVLLNGRLVAAQDAWERYATGAEFDGEGWWASPAEPLKTCALDASGRMVNTPIGRLYRQKVRETLRCVRLADGSQLTITARHRLLTGEGWSTQIAPGSVVAVPRRLDWPGPRPPAGAVAATTRRALLTDRPLPDCVLRADRDSARVALRTALDTAGVLDRPRRQVSIACACLLLGEQLRLLLRRFAILASRAAHTGLLTIAGAALPRLLAEIGFSNPQPPAWLLAAAATDTEPGESDGASIATPAALLAAGPTSAWPGNAAAPTAQPAPGRSPIATSDGEQSDAYYLPVVDVREVFHDG